MSFWILHSRLLDLKILSLNSDTNCNTNIEIKEGGELDLINKVENSCKLLHNMSRTKTKVNPIRNKDSKEMKG